METFDVTNEELRHLEARRKDKNNQETAVSRFDRLAGSPSKDWSPDDAVFMRQELTQRFAG
jgi:hypothetical protein